jgi:D-ribulokinase
MPRHLIGVDVGTGSARAGVFTPDGTMLASAKHDITLYREAGSLLGRSLRVRSGSRCRGRNRSGQRGGHWL